MDNDILNQEKQYGESFSAFITKNYLGARQKTVCSNSLVTLLFSKVQIKGVGPSTTLAWPGWKQPDIPVEVDTG